MAPIESHRQPIVVQTFFDAVSDAAGANKHLSDDAGKAILQDSNLPVPASVEALLTKFDSAHHPKILDGVRRGIEKYTEEHGFAPDSSFIEFAIDRATRTATPLKDLGLGMRLDSATNNHHDQLSLQPAVAIVSIMAMFEEAIPYAMYLSADIKNNEARLAIMDNKANSDFGEYLVNDSFNGIAAGGSYFSSECDLLLSTNGGGGTALTATLTQKHAPAVVGGVAVGAGNAALPLLRGRTVILVNGLPAAREAENTGGSGNNTLAGSITVASIAYAITGTANSDTGLVSVLSAPALPAGTVVQALAYVDFERGPQWAPKIGTEVNVYKMFARSSRGIVQNTIDAMTQMNSELGLDPRGQALLALRSQFSQESHYKSLNKMFQIGKASPFAATWNYDYTAQIAQKDRYQLWLNLMPVLALASQQMAQATVDHGVTTLYFTGLLAAELRGLPNTVFESSGITDRPGIYRLGRLFGLYDCYYTPKGLAETSTTSQILAIGRATNVARNPYVMGDAVPPIFLPLATGTDLVTQDGFYTRGFAEINPHLPSAQSSILIAVTNRG